MMEAAVAGDQQIRSEDLYIFQEFEPRKKKGREVVTGRHDGENSIDRTDDAFFTIAMWTTAMPGVLTKNSCLNVATCSTKDRCMKSGVDSSRFNYA